MKNCLILLFFLTLISCKSDKYDLIIINGTILDGTGSDSFQADIGILDERIVEIGDLKNAEAKTIIDASGMVVSPGFIDMHTHLEPIMEMPDAKSLIMQGVTLALGGPDGGGPWPFGSYLDSLEQLGTGPNLAYLIGHNTIRREVMGNVDQAPTLSQMDSMKNYVEMAMKEGAFGISTGLKYLPGTFAKVDEIISLSKVASSYQGIYTSHLREEGLGLIDAVQEAILISKEAEIPVVLTHHKAIGVKMWGASVKTLSLVDSARKEGLDIMMDQYPYAASHTGISVLIPSWALEGSEFSNRVQDPILKDSIKSGIIFNILNDRGGNDLRRIQFSRVSWRKELEGKTLHDWAILEGMEPTVENGAELVIQAQLNGGTGTIYHAMDEADVERIMKHPMTMIGSDGRLSQPGDGHPHPRAYGTFPRILGYYVREKNILDLPTAIHKMTGLSAQRLGIQDRGIIKKGNFADLTIFDPEKIIDRSTFTDPHQYPTGVQFVLVNGQLIVDQGEFQDIRPGKILRKNKMD
ncbi:MAG TPA: aminoacylase [Algoriphagus sp.]|jgi:N-acyl-D-aspartate/D-glutamate deacylase|uniref:N-acyl-D-amino-acid deacylase family protein n=1 Tax=unclassified Algoriphagus TaxID=2641541 RepID=UPI000E7F0283|nr:MULTISPECIES: D-aminoacylase [unclassified Algoriphagus]HAD51449.1 aminoacylase [Algoriphagus sp.]HAS60403.1 aminoacylase [Algoriphagus sp.]HAZ25285.1 aminoacylase [Algoriphagus sp.]